MKLILDIGDAGDERVAVTVKYENGGEGWNILDGELRVTPWELLDITTGLALGADHEIEVTCNDDLFAKATVKA